MNQSFPTEVLPGVMDVWVSGQIGLPLVIRWKKFLQNGKAREQNSLQHSYSIAVFAIIFVKMLEKYASFDKEIIMDAVLLHDHGEGELKRDILYNDKEESHDFDEYLAFVTRFGQLPEAVFKKCQRAFLLQFALSNPVSFPEKARAIMQEIAEKQKVEALIFRALEYCDYFLYALEQYQELDNVGLMVLVLGNHIPHFEQLAKELPGFKEVFWTEEVSRWCYEVFSRGEENT